MHKLLLVALLNLSFFVANAAFLKDATFIAYGDFSRLSKNEIKQRFGKDEESQKIIANYYKHKRKPFKKLWAIIPLTAIGSYFAVLAANATNGMGSTVGLVLAILFLLPASILVVALLASLFHGKNASLKMLMYEELKRYYQSR